MTTTAEQYGVSEKQWQNLQRAYAAHRSYHSANFPFSQCEFGACRKHSRVARWKLMSAKNAGKLARFPAMETKHGGKDFPGYCTCQVLQDPTSCPVHGEQDMTTPTPTPYVLNRFRGDLFYLSNFFLVDIPFNNTLYRSVEHAYHAARTDDPAWKERIRQAATPGEAKRLGRQAPLSPSFEANKLSHMRTLVALKFAPGTQLAQLLIGTGQATLIEGNTWHDIYWGQCECEGCNGKGENMLGKLLMEQRERLQRLEATDDAGGA